MLHPVYLAMDGHFGNYPAFHMVRQCGLHLISKLRWDAALCFPWDGTGHKCKYGERVDYAHLLEKYLKSTMVKDGFQTCTYQAQLLHEDFSPAAQCGHHRQNQSRYPCLGARYSIQQ